MRLDARGELEMPYYADLRPAWRKVIEFPFRLLGLVRYNPLTPIPRTEMVFKQ